MSARSIGSSATPTVQLVLSPQSRRVVHAMIRDANRHSGGDAVLAHWHKLPPTQRAAAFAAILNTAKITRKPGRPAKPYTLTVQEARAAYTRYKRGERDEATITGYREHQRRAAAKYRETARAKRAIA